MKKIWKLLRNHWSSDFDWKMYGSIAVFLAISVILNYKFNFENGIIDKDTGKPIRILWYFLTYAFGYFGVSVIVFYCRNSFHFFKSPRYWAITLFGLIVTSYSVGFPYTRAIADALTKDSPQLYRWVFGITTNMINFFIVAIPVIVAAWFYEKKRENFGINKQYSDFSPYWQILALVAPLVLIASFEAGFSNYYPIYKRYALPDNSTGIPPYLLALGFELAYGMDFFNVEFLFRGVLVIGVSQVIGKEAILPMVSAYCFLHFGKPAGECVSSIFGGYILGVVAFYTRNIWGGVIVHVGLAWMMELAAFIQQSLN